MTEKNLVYRQGSMFKINSNLIKPEFRKVNIINGLYAALYDEFKGAIHNDKYSQMTSGQRLEKINEFAMQWLQIRGFI